MQIQVRRLTCLYKAVRTGRGSQPTGVSRGKGTGTRGVDQSAAEIDKQLLIQDNLLTIASGLLI